MSWVWFVRIIDGANTEPRKNRFFKGDDQSRQGRASLVRGLPMAAPTEMVMVCNTTVKHTVKRGLLLC